MTTSTELKFSILKYTPKSSDDIVADDIDVVIPTIQNININVNDNIISKPTITGNTLAQYSKSKPTTVSINILLQTDANSYTYLGEEVAASDILQHINTISNDKLVFDLITTDSNLTEYLSGLVVQSKTFSKSADRKNSIVCTLSCIEVRFADVGWNKVSKADILGVTIGDIDDSVRELSGTMIRNNDAAVKFAFTKQPDFYILLGLLARTAAVNDTPGQLTGHYLYDKGLPYTPSYYLELDGIVIDLTKGPAEYTINTNFSLSETTNSEDEVAEIYNANFGDIRVKVNAENDSVALSRQGTVATPYNLISENTLLLLSSMKLEESYNVLNQYSQFDIHESFDKFVDRKKISETIARRIEDKNFVRDLDYIVGGLPSDKRIIIVENLDKLSIISDHYLLAKDITSLYSYEITMGDKDTGGIQTPITGAASACDIQHREFNQFYATRGQFEFYDTADASHGRYNSQLVSVCVGTKLYLFIISVDIFTTTNVLGDTSV